MKDIEISVEKGEAQEDRELGISTSSVKERAMIYKDIPLIALGPEADMLLLEAKQALVDHTNNGPAARGEGFQTKSSPEQKIEVAVIYSMTGSLIETSREANIDYHLVTEWSLQPWWPKAVKLGRFYKDNQFHSMISDLSEICLIKLKDRITRGEVSTSTLLQAMKVVGEEKRETKKALSGASEQDKQKEFNLKIAAKLREITLANEAKDITPKKRNKVKIKIEEK